MELQQFLPELKDDGIYGAVSDYGSQEEERETRGKVASESYEDYLNEVSKHHSIPVMDREVSIFLKKIPQNGLILDIGGCWGWHWRSLVKTRPDVKVFILDLVRENLNHAKEVLKEGLNKNFFLVHGNALDLSFDEEVFDGVWSVQTTQHIPNYEKVVSEVYRVLKPEGVFSDYRLNYASLVRFLRTSLGKKYHIDGRSEQGFYMRRADSSQVEIIKHKFKSEVNIRYSEVLFTPDLKLPIGGTENSILGKLDSLLSTNLKLFSPVARQRSLFAIKKG